VDRQSKLTSPDLSVPPDEALRPTAGTSERNGGGLAHRRGMAPRDVEVAALSPQRLSRLIGDVRLEKLINAATHARAALGGARVWNVSSTSVGGGVAEMLNNLVGYSIGSGIDAHWVVIEGDKSFFDITKRLHNRLHGAAGDGGALGRLESAHYDAVMDENVAALMHRVIEGDVVVLHDPQTLGLAGPLIQRGARVVWRCHIGTERSNGYTEEVWRFLEPYLAHCLAYVFSHDGFVPQMLRGAAVFIIAPSIDPYAAKNQPLTRAEVDRLLVGVGLFDGNADPGSVAGSVLGGAGPLSRDDRMVVQVSRWDHLKDMQGVIEGFAAIATEHRDLRLALVGPEVSAVSDDPEGAEVLGECMTQWQNLPQKRRSAIRIVTLPMADFELNALMVNAVQRHATVVVQKSLEEGFGLTVAEAMWKSRPVVASAVGGIVDQVVPGTGILLSNPSDLDIFGKALADLLSKPGEMAAMGRRARAHIRSHFLSDRHLVDYARLIEAVTHL
jgi:trehalose synthase